MLGMFRRRGTAERVEPHFDAPLPARPQAATYTLRDVEELSQLFGLPGPTAAGKTVNSETAMRQSAVFACVRLIAGAIAGLPLPVYQTIPGGRERVQDHPVDVVLNAEPFEAVTAFAFWEYFVACILLRGDGIALLIRSGAGEVVGMMLVDPGAVQIERRGSRLAYFVAMPDGDARGFDQDDVLHVAGPGFNGTSRLRGMSVISYAAREAIGTAMAMEEFSGRFFTNGARANLAVTYERGLKEDQIEQLHELIRRSYSAPENSHKPLILPNNPQVKELSLSAQDTQLIQGRQFQVVDIARAFGVPPFMIGETEKTTSWGSGVETMSIGFVQYTLKPHLQKIEQEANRKIFRNRRYFCEHNVEGLLRGDAKTRSGFYREAIGGAKGPGWMSTNEVRRLENLPPMDDGDALFNPNNLKDMPDEEPTSQAVPG